MKEKERDLLDRALAGQPTDVKARVLDIVLRLGLDPTDDLFVVMIAFGFLQVLLEDYPDTLTTLFDDFRGDLNQWSAQHLDILEALTQKAQNEETLALNSISLLNGLDKLTDICSVLMKQLPTSANASPSSPVVSMGSREIDNWGSVLRQDIQNQGGQVLTLLDRQNRQWSEISKLVNRLWVVVLCQGIGLVGLAVWLIVFDH